MTRLLFIHNKAMWYRIPLFKKIDKFYDINFIFTEEDDPLDLDFKYRILKRYGVYPFNITFGLIRILFSEKYDIIVFPPMDSPGEIVDDLICFFVAKLRKKPYIVWSERWYCPEVRKKGLKKFYQIINTAFFKFISKYSGACLTSGGTKQGEYYHSLGVSYEKIFTVPYLSNIPSKNYSTEDLELKGNKILSDLKIENKKVILCVSRLIERKGIDYLIMAFAKLKKELDDTVLFIVGGECYYGYDAYYGDTLLELCKKYNVEKDVFFLGHVDSSDMPIYYQLCNLLVFPSIAESFADTGCLPVSDAMYFGKPVISTDVVGFAYDLIDNGINGFMVPQKDVNTLCNSMKAILLDPGLEKEMGKKSKEIIKKFDYNTMVKGFNDAINYILKD